MTQVSSKQPAIVLLGASGMLGRAWRQLLEASQMAYVAPSHAQLDLTNPQALAQVIGPGVRQVINCAAYTAVDDAESHESEAMRLNAEAVGWLADSCKNVNAQLIHFSTDYVFSGKAQKPYAVDTPRQPCNAYGRSKAAGEIQIEQSGCDYLIIRTSWLYAPWGNNFVRTIARLAQQKKTLAVVDDQRGRPTSCSHLAKITWRLIQTGAKGIYHVCDEGQCTWFAFAQRIVEKTHADCQVTPCKSDAFPRPAARPAYSVLDMSQTLEKVGPMSDWQHNLDEVLRQLEKEEPQP